VASDLSALDDLVEGQDRGLPCIIRHPVTGESIGTMTIVGPDSDGARAARLKYEDELYGFRGRPPASELDRMHIERLARLVVSWDVKRDSTVVPFSFTEVVKLLRSHPSVRTQVEAFSNDRAPWFLRLPFEEESK
jgi:hypothetical protein